MVESRQDEIPALLSLTHPTNLMQIESGFLSSAHTNVNLSLVAEVAEVLRQLSLTVWSKLQGALLEHPAPEQQQLAEARVSALAVSLAELLRVEHLWVEDL